MHIVERVIHALLTDRLKHTSTLDADAHAELKSMHEELTSYLEEAYRLPDEVVELEAERRPLLEAALNAVRSAKQQLMIAMEEFGLAHAAKMQANDLSVEELGAKSAEFEKALVSTHDADGQPLPDTEPKPEEPAPLTPPAPPAEPLPSALKEIDPTPHPEIVGGMTDEEATKQ